MECTMKAYLVDEGREDDLRYSIPKRRLELEAALGALGVEQ